MPGLENAKFARLGGIHRNSFIDAPALLDEQLRLKAAPHLRFAGQITGVEGYVESAAIGLLAGRFAAGETDAPPATTALGAVLGHVTGPRPEAAGAYQPMNVNFGLFPPLDGRFRGRERKRAYAARALADLDRWLDGRREAA